jgi:hypothetical protein
VGDMWDELLREPMHDAEGDSCSVGDDANEDRSIPSESDDDFGIIQLPQGEALDSEPPESHGFAEEPPLPTQMQSPAPLVREPPASNLAQASSVVIGGASSSVLPAVPSNVPPPSPPPASLAWESAAPAAPARWDQNPALAIVRCPGGKLSLYIDKRCEAECSNPAHGRCRRTRTIKVSTKDRHLGRLMAWIQSSDHFNNRKEHFDDFTSIPKIGRVGGRRVLRERALGGCVNSQTLLDAEGPSPEGFDSEGDVL